MSIDRTNTYSDGYYQTAINQVIGTQKADRIQLLLSEFNFFTYGLRGNDRVFGTSGTDTVLGGGGKDVLKTRGGDDHLWGQKEKIA